MTLSKLREMTHIYARDTNSYVFPEDYIDMFINQAIDRLRQYPAFRSMNYLSASSDEVDVLPSQYHYMLALFAASRCFDIDERFYEGVEKRNEFEDLLDSLLAEIQSGNLDLMNSEDELIEDDANYTEYVTDIYFDNGGEDDGETIL